ncbi:MULTISPECIES: DUF3179 domain-containing (seleno)protein [unclassified Agarivorans]|uniref:DUF3179 domain-containing (seleno)protein n=1 Tax=unclassified Agarivorans TaxID=2636026 RepID=UPI0026E18C7A|nr:MULTISPECIES: DUF3179 domain-containing (seleno)protein [unclassified Agarivorans]MDO6686585.1 DUF3179 domain-containing (seleno)protein [Agarivorans sp. 3_MG-2023]MDO6715403.1 DUF3179 domain-containing (seleno)protein [Agarivorans sp. 2_MG-2023]MDO6763280.1 DUF3179 domain-containing (seleno)protein [Agarivorans sp. 1_MG-2023]
MLSSVLIGAGLAVAMYYAFIIFMELGDFGQWVVKSTRKKTMRAWHKRKTLSRNTLISLAVAWLGWLLLASHISLLMMLVVSAIILVMYFSGAINPDIMMRARQENAVFLSPEQAAQFYRDDESVIVYEHNGQARAHSDKQLVRPHVVGDQKHGQSNVVMTYCGLTNLGMAVVPEINGQALSLRPVLQLENNLVMADANTDQPVQQLWARRECDINAGIDGEMQQVATFRMPFAKFKQAYPEGLVFVNDYQEKGMRVTFWENPAVFLYDRMIELIFGLAINAQHNLDKPVFPTIKHVDKRLPSKRLVWAFNVGEHYIAYTEEFVVSQGGVVNLVVDGQSIVVNYDQEMQSLGVFYNPSKQPVKQLDFAGYLENGKQLQRVETLKAGIFWIVWANFFPQTELNPTK